MNHKIRLGPIAVFLAVIAAVVATLAMLTFATSRADTSLAERFAKVTAIRYGLEEDGNRFLQAADAVLNGTGMELPDGAEQTENGFTYYTEKDGYALSIELAAGKESPGYEVTKWKITKLWEAEDPFTDLWLG